MTHSAERVRTYSDGGARGNPGPGGIGVLICDPQDKILMEHKDTIGHATNNVAEYCALVAALTIAVEIEANEVEAFLDSELVVKQLTGQYRVKNEAIKQLVAEVRGLEKNFGRVSYQHLPRTHVMMRGADKLVNMALDEQAYGGV